MYLNGLKISLKRWTIFLGNVHLEIILFGFFKAKLHDRLFLSILALTVIISKIVREMIKVQIIK
jgi:hypothetical protein